MSILNKNTRIGTVNNLAAGGTYDILMLGYPDGFPEGRITFEIGETPRAITGVQKVAQTFLKILLSSKGSDVIRPNSGTIFPNYFMHANLNVSSTPVRSEIISALMDAEAQTKVAMNASSDPASRLSKIELAGFDTSTESITMYVQMTTADGVNSQIAVPFPELELN